MAIPEIDYTNAFRTYSDPKKARRVWTKYEADMHRFDVIGLGIDALNACSNSTALDLKLYLLTEPHRRETARAPKKARISEEVHYARAD